jgi:acetyl esterase
VSASALDPQVQTVLREMAAAPRPQSIEEARTGYDRTSLRWVGEPEEVASVRDERVGEACVRVYEPVDHRGGALLWIHGGGWIMGNLSSYDPLCRALANRAGVVVVSVDYRLAPESPFPGPVEDSEAALRWLASSYAGEPLAVAGDSAGGNIAAVLARRARDAGGPQLAFQLLVYPVTDAACATASMRSYGADDAFGLSREAMMVCWAAYAGGASARSPDASPLRAPDLSGLPPALLVLAECDPLTDEGLDYAERLSDAGVEVETKVWPGMVHGFLRWRAAIDVAHTALDEAAGAVRDALDRAA